MAWPEARVAVVPLASRVHGEEYYSAVLRSIRSPLIGHGFEFTSVVTSPSDVEELKLDQYDVIVLLFLTGGTSGLARRVAGRVPGKPLALLAHPYHNSLPSALSAKSRLEAEGRGRVVLHLYRGDLARLSAFARAVKAVAALRRATVLHLDASSVTEEARLYMERVGGEVVAVSRDELVEAMSEVTGEELESAKLELLEHIDLGGVDAGKLECPLRLYVAARKLLERFKASMVTIDCFPFIEFRGCTPCVALAMLLASGVPAACEADYRALLLLALGQLLTNRSAWMANPSDIVEGADGRIRLVLAHCTVAPTLTTYATLLPHFETSLPYAVAGRLPRGTYTMAAVSPDYSRLVAVRVEVEESGTLSGGRCRTQAVVASKSRYVAEFTSRAVSNHHVIIPGDVRFELSIAGKLMGMEVHTE